MVHRDRAIPIGEIVVMWRPPGPCPQTRDVTEAAVEPNLPSPTEDVENMTYEDALELASRDEGFMATVYAMNTLLIHKGIYTQQEFQQLFVEWVQKEQRKKARTQKPIAQAAYSQA